MNRIRIAFYEGKQDNYLLRKNKTKALLRLLSLLRLLVFVLVFVSLYMFFGKSQILAISVAVFFLGFFLFLLKYYNKKALLRDYYNSLVEINRNEIEALKEEKFY